MCYCVHKPCLLRAITPIRSVAAGVHVDRGPPALLLPVCVHVDVDRRTAHGVHAHAGVRRRQVQAALLLHGGLR